MSMLSWLFILGGVWNILDGVFSLLHPKLGHWQMADAVRIIRIVFGLGMVIGGVLV